MRSARFALFVLLAGLVTAGVLTNSPPRSRTVVFAEHPVPSQPSVGAPGSLSTTWFCAGAPLSPDGTSTATLVLTNPTAVEAVGIVTIVPTDGSPIVRPTSVPASGRLTLSLGTLVNAGWAAATIEMHGSPVGAEIVTASVLGTDASPCSSSASREWYFASGSTAVTETVKAREYITLYNPYPDDAAVDISFVTNEGPLAPAALKGFVVPSGQLRIVDLTSSIARKDAIASSIIARSGSVVAGRLQTYDGTSRTGTTFAGGATAGREQWLFPYGEKANGVTNSLVVYNPTDSPAAVDLTFTLDGGQAEPLELTVQAHSALTTSLDAIPQLPSGTPFSVWVKVTNGTPVVAEQVTDVTAVSGQVGSATTLGATGPALRWLLGAGGVGAAQSEVLAIFNPGQKAITVSVTGIAPEPLAIPGLANIQIAAGARLVIKLGDHIQLPNLPMVVEASAPVVVLRVLNQLGPPVAAGAGPVAGTGTSMQMGIVWP